jgi:hypothetical protein
MRTGELADVAIAAALSLLFAPVIYTLADEFPWLTICTSNGPKRAPRHDSPLKPCHACAFSRGDDEDD